MTDRRRHQARAEARREALLTAAAEVAAQHGTAAVTHRSVTERAGMPLATASYFFSSIDDLAAEAMRVFTARRTAELLSVAEGLRRDRCSPDEIAGALAEAAGSQQSWGLAQFEAYLHAARTPDFRPTVAETVEAFEHVATVALEAAGAREPRQLAASFVALADGYALRALALPGSVAPGALHRAFRALFLGAVLDGQDRQDDDGTDRDGRPLRPVSGRPGGGREDR